MNEILKFLMRYCSFLYEIKGFKFINSATSESFGNASLTLGSTFLNIRFIRDRGQLFTDFQSNLYGKKNAQSWYSIDIVRQLISNEKKYYALMDSKNATFLRNHIDIIIDLFSRSKVKDTILKLKRLETIRAKTLFKER